MGSTFVFTLPVEPGEAVSEPKRVPRQLHRREVGVLAVVERTAVLSRLLSRHIEGMPIASVTSVAELAALGTLPYEVVLINEPNTSAHTELPLPDVPGSVPVFHCYVHGAVALPMVDGESVAGPNHFYLVKPVNRDQLYATFSDMLALRRDSDGGVFPRAASVLIVEDDEDAAYLLGRMLRVAPADVLQGYNGVAIHKARSGSQAIELLHASVQPGAEPFDAVFLDLVLGTVSGYAVLGEMELCEALCRLPVCVVTGQIAGDDVLVTPYLAFARKGGFSTRELAQAVVALTKIALPGVDVAVR